jgi:hypothetical protein
MTDKKEEKVKHDNIYAALSAFQGENPQIKKTKLVDIKLDTGRRITYKYAPLDEFVTTIRPLLAKHGLSFTHEEAGEGKIRCVLYHETTKSENLVVRETTFSKESEELEKGEKHYRTVMDNVIMSMPITIRRAGDMKNIGADATYARRYTLAEVTGCASDEDNDAPIEEESAKNAVKTVYVLFKDKINNGTKIEIEKCIKSINEGLMLIDNGKAPKLGLTADQYEELGRLAEVRLNALGIADDIQTQDPTK